MGVPTLHNPRPRPTTSDWVAAMTYARHSRTAIPALNHTRNTLAATIRHHNLTLLTRLLPNTQDPFYFTDRWMGLLSGPHPQLHVRDALGWIFIREQNPSLTLLNGQPPFTETIDAWLWHAAGYTPTETRHHTQHPNPDTPTRQHLYTLAALHGILLPTFNTGAPAARAP